MRPRAHDDRLGRPGDALVQKNLDTPLHRLLTIAKHTKELTPGSEKITSNAVRALLAPIPLPSLMNEEDAKFCL